MKKKTIGVLPLSISVVSIGIGSFFFDPGSGVLASGDNADGGTVEDSQVQVDLEADESSQLAQPAAEPLEVSERKLEMPSPHELHRLNWHDATSSGLEPIALRLLACSDPNIPNVAFRVWRCACDAGPGGPNVIYVRGIYTSAGEVAPAPGMQVEGFPVSVPLPHPFLRAAELTTEATVGELP